MKTKPKTKSIQAFFSKKFNEREFRKAYEDIGLLMDIAISVSQARNKRGLSQSDLAKSLKTTQSVVSRIENGNQNLSLKMLMKIALVLDCDLSFDLKPHKMAA